jgi:DNA-binding NarL/FixJ family response regulator
VSPPIRIVVGEADYLAREGLVRAIEAVADIEVVSICSSTAALRQAVEAEQPDVVVTALHLTGAANGDRDTITVICDLRRQRSSLGILVLGDAGDATEAMFLFDRDVSGCGFMLRDRISNAAELTRAIREIAAGSAVVDPAAVGTFLNAARQPRNVTLDRLTVRERQVLTLLAAAESNNAIARDLGITTRAVERHVNSIFRKLDLEDSGDTNRRVRAALLFTSSTERAGRPARRRPASTKRTGGT